MSGRQLSRTTKAALAKLRLGLEEGEPQTDQQFTSRSLARASAEPNIASKGAGRTLDLDRYIKQPYHIDYVHSFGQDSPFFAGLANRRLLGTRCRRCNYTYATPRLSCMVCGSETDWVDLPKTGRVHTFTTCYFGSEEFLPECPFSLILVEFEGADTLFLARLVGAQPKEIRVGMEVEARFLRNAKFKPTDVYFVPRRP